MELIYRSTRNANETATASEAILKGLANEGGLFVPDSIPALDVSLTDLAQMNYQQVAYEVMKLMFTDFTEEELKHLHIIWNYSTVQRLHLRIWHYPFFLICLQHPQRRIM